MFAIKVMDFYVKISDVFPDDEQNTIKKVDYVTESVNATSFPKASDAALEAEKFEISGFTVERL